jgi:predicted MPP superfamily phosphohydrolase
VKKLRAVTQTKASEADHLSLADNSLDRPLPPLARLGRRVASTVVPNLTRRRFLQLSAAALAATAIDGIATSTDIKLEHHRLTLPNWDATGFRVAQVTDVHLNNTGMRDRAHEAIAMAMDLKPDLLVFTGDFLNIATDECLGYVREVFGRLSEAGCPCLAITGNHDYTCEATPKLFATVAETPIRLLRNEIVEVAGITVFGIDDAVHGHPDFSLSGAQVASRSRLVLLHEPDFVSRLAGNPSLVLSGHSHGGEICLPGGIPIHTPVGAQIYKAGYYPKAPFPLYVSRGVGTLGPCRVFCPPEVTLFTLYGRES